jgi:hypothetical protein
MNGNFKWLLSILSGVVIVIVAGWLITTSAEVKSTSTDVAVIKAEMKQFRCDISEIKEGVRGIGSEVRDIRSDQLRRERKENNK